MAEALWSRSASATLGWILAVSLGCRTVAGIDTIDFSEPSGSGGGAGSGGGSAMGGSAGSGGNAGSGGSAGSGGGAGSGGTAGGGYAALVLSDGPAAYYRFDEASGSRAADATGHGNDGSYNYPTLGVPGALAGDLDTANQFEGDPRSNVFLDDKFDFVGKAAHSIEFWMKPRVVDAQTRRLFEKAGTGGGYFAILDSGGIVAYRGESTSNNMDVISAPGPFPMDRFTYVALTFDGAQLKLYRDGVPVQSEPSFIALADTTFPFVIGEGFAGVLDEFAIYSKALDPTQIQAHYRAGHGP